jgi:hypothetical protein
VRFCDHDLGLIDRRGVRCAPPRRRPRKADEAAKDPKLSTINPVQNVGHQPG